MDATVARGARECPALPRCGGRRRHARFERSSNGLLQIVDPWSREKSRAGPDAHQGPMFTTIRF